MTTPHCHWRILSSWYKIYEERKRHAEFISLIAITKSTLSQSLRGHNVTKYAILFRPYIPVCAFIYISECSYLIIAYNDIKWLQCNYLIIFMFLKVMKFHNTIRLGRTTNICMEVIIYWQTINTGIPHSIHTRIHWSSLDLNVLYDKDRSRGTAHAMWTSVISIWVEQNNRIQLWYGFYCF